MCPPWSSGCARLTSGPDRVQSQSVSIGICPRPRMSLRKAHTPHAPSGHAAPLQVPAPLSYAGPVSTISAGRQQPLSSQPSAASKAGPALARPAAVWAAASSRRRARCGDGRSLPLLPAPSSPLRRGGRGAILQCTPIVTVCHRLSHPRHHSLRCRLHAVLASADGWASTAALGPAADTEATRDAAVNHRRGFGGRQVEPMEPTPPLSP